MRRLLVFLACLGLVCASSVLLAKGKPKAVVPPYVLSARTVAVLIDPSAGIDPNDPAANERARRDVEEALDHWGRFEPVTEPEQADLLIVIRRGSGKLVNQTISNPRQNQRPGSVSPDGDAVEIGNASRGNTPLNDGTVPGTPAGGAAPHPQVEMGAANDQFLVYEGHSQAALDGPVAWRWTRKDALQSPEVPAVDEFRKAIQETEEAAQQQQKKKP